MIPNFVKINVHSTDLIATNLKMSGFFVQCHAHKNKKIKETQNVIRHTYTLNGDMGVLSFYRHNIYIYILGNGHILSIHSHSTLQSSYPTLQSARVFRVEVVVIHIARQLKLR